jgi:acyl-CoA reductase-like NAD-dependent aldehyde dehydrogenase
MPSQSSPSVADARKFSNIINGHSIAASSHIPVTSPSTGEIAGLMPVGTKDDLDRAVAAARSAFASWSVRPDKERQKLCVAIGEKIGAHSEELARLLTLEQGKPLNGLGSRWEIGGARAWNDYTASLEISAEVLQNNNEGRVELHRKPIGVVGSITPWNFPVLIAIWHIIPAIRVGNTVVIKPSPYTPLATIRLVELINEVLPAGVVNVVAGNDDLGAAMSSHPGIDKMVFTGSAPTGRRIMASAAETLKRLTLELGGNDAAIVLPDVNPKEIAEGLFWGAFLNNGQTCACIKRLYVHDSIYDEVCEALKGLASKIKVGDGVLEDSVLGPIQNKMQFEKVRSYVDDARNRGARILTGGAPLGGSGFFFPITLVADAKHGMPLVDEEQFGPVLPIIRYTDLDEAITRANDNPNGLGGSIWSADVAKARDLARRLECGTAWVNKHGAIQPNAPFGGIKQSGFGVEFGQEGLHQNTTVQTIIS